MGRNKHGKFGWFYGSVILKQECCVKFQGDETPKRATPEYHTPYSKSCQVIYLSNLRNPLLSLSYSFAA